MFFKWLKTLRVVDGQNLIVLAYFWYNIYYFKFIALNCKRMCVCQDVIYYALNHLFVMHLSRYYLT